MSVKTIEMLFELSVRWETQARDLFAEFAVLFRYEPEVSEFWMQLSKDEAMHIRVLREIVDRIPAERRLAEVSDRQWNSIAEVEELMKKASSRKILTLDDAYDLAHQLETSEVNTLFKMLVIDYLPDEGGHEFIVSEVTEHVERLMRFGKKYAQTHRKLITAAAIH